MFTYFFEEWHYFAWLVCIGYSLLLVGFFFVVREDPIYLFNSGQLSALMALLEGVGGINGATPE